MKPSPIFRILKLQAACVFLITSIFLTPAHAQIWIETGTGVNALNANAEIESICADPFGNIYAVGEFTDGLPFPNGHQYVAKWNGTAWSKLGTGSSALDTNCLLSGICADASGNLYVAGIVTTDGWQVAKWDGTTWSQLGTGTNALNANAGFNAICVDPFGNVYVAGDFTDGSGNNYVAKWNGTTWAELGTGSSGSTTTLCSDPFGNIYASGNFTDISGNYFVAKWNGTAWNELGSGFGSYVYQICSTPAGVIYIVGDFTGYAAKWNGSSWTTIGSYFNSRATAIYSDAAGYVYAGGDFFDTYFNEYVAIWSGAWSHLGIGGEALSANGRILAICSDSHGSIYAGGQFKNTSGYYYVAKYVAPNGIVSQNYGLHELHVFPNPSIGTFSVELPNGFTDGSITITNASGKVIRSVEIKNNTSSKIGMDMRALPRGTYTLQAVSEAVTASALIAVQ